MAVPTFRAAGTWAFTATSVANPSTLSPGAPAGVQVGDLLLLVAGAFNNTATAATPTGWTLLTGFPVVSVNSAGGVLYVFARIADGTATDTPSLVWSSLATGTTGTSAGAGLLAYSNAQASLDGSIVSSDLGGQTTTSTIPDITTGSDESLVIGIALKLIESSGQTSTVSGRTERVDSQTTSGKGHIIEVCDTDVTPAGSAGTATVIWSAATSGRALTVSLALLAASSSTPANATGSCDATSTATGAATAPGQMSGSSAAAASASGAPNVTGQLAGSASAAGSTSGLAKVTGQASGAAAATASATGQPTLTVLTSAAMNASGSMTGAANVIAQLAGNATGAGSATGQPTVIAQLLGSAPAFAVASGQPTASSLISGSSNATGGIAALARVPAQLSGTSSALGAATGTPATPGPALATGSADAQSDATATAIVTAQLAGNALALGRLSAQAATAANVTSTLDAAGVMLLVATAPALGPRLHTPSQPHLHTTGQPRLHASGQPHLHTLREPALHTPPTP